MDTATENGATGLPNHDSGYARELEQCLSDLIQRNGHEMNSTHSWDRVRPLNFICPDVGNAVVDLKPCEHARACALRVVDILRLAGWLKIGEVALLSLWPRRATK